MRIQLLAKVAFSAAVLAATATASARAEEFAGELRCSISGGFGLVVWAKRATSCVYYRNDGRVEFYIGSLGHVGLDLGTAQPRQAIFKVMARGPEAPGALAGDFVGAGAGATLGSGFAGDSLMGGRGGGIVMMPAANSRLTGLNAAVAFGALHLRYAGTEGRRAPDRNTNPDDAD